MFLLSEKEWITNDIPLKISREENLDLSGDTDVQSAQIWKFLPLGEWIVCNKVCVLVNTSSFLFLVGIFDFSVRVLFTITIASFFYSLSSCLNNVVIFLSTTDFTKESYERGRLLSSQLL